MSERETRGTDVRDGLDADGLEYTQEFVPDRPDTDHPDTGRPGTEGLDADGLEHTQEFVADREPDTSSRPSATDRTDSGPRRRPHVDVTPTGMIPAVPGPGATRRQSPPPRRDWVDVVDQWFPEHYRVPMILTTAVSLVLTLTFLFLPLTGTGLASQVARGHFFALHGWHPVDFRWYGGIFPVGYSLFAGPLNALLGARVVGALSCVLSSTAFAWLLVRHRVARPALGGVLAAVVGVSDLISGRTTFALGLAIGMGALVAVSLPRARRGVRLTLGLVLATASTLTDPLVGLFVGLAGGAVLLAGLRRAPGSAPTGPVRRLAGHVGGGWREGLVLCLGPVIGVTPSLLFPGNGVQPFTSDAMKVSLAVGVASFFLVPARYRAVRIGTVLMIALTLLVFLVPGPVGSNVTRLPVLFSAPLIAAVSRVDRRLLVVAVLALTWWQPPLVSGDLGGADDQAAQPGFYQPLIDRLKQAEPVGRVEVVPLYDHWESTYVAEAVPLARGARRQVDVERNPIFYGTRLASDTYLAWLYRNAVGYVAVPKQAHLDRYGREEANLIAAKPPYLKQIWSNADWTLYRVVGAQQLVSGAGSLVTSGPTGVTFEAKTSGQTTVRVRWSRWLTLSGKQACLRPSPKGWVDVQVGAPGRYRLSSGWHLTQAHRC